VASPSIWMVALGQFAVLDAHLSETDLSLQVEQAVLRLEMAWDCSLHPPLVLSVMELRVGQEAGGEHGPQPNVALDECFKRSKHRFHL